MTAALFQPLTLNPSIQLKNRILMAPLTRCMAGEGLVPTQEMADYYARRADAGLIISEAVIIRPDGQGYPNTPGIFNAQQIAGWQRVTQAVHANGGKIFAQLWHTGRVAHPYFWGGEAPVAPSAIGLQGTVPRMRELEYQQPKALSEAEIQQLVADYASAAQNAIDAGFDGVEIHGANGYLIDQFLHYSSNQRSDNYGGSAENMARFALAVVDAISAQIGSDRTALRVSPAAYFNIEPDARDRQVFDYLLTQLNQRPLAYLHAGVFEDSIEYDYLDGRVSDYLRREYQGTLVGVGGLQPQQAAQAISEQRFELAAIGRPFIANPDYVQLVQQGLPLKDYHESQLAVLY